MTCPHCESTATVERPEGFNERTGTPYNRLQYPTDVVCLVVLWRFRVLSN